MKNIIFYFTISVSVLLSTLVSFNALSQQEGNALSENFSDAELAQILAPIALYPDTLLTHILIASTYPIEVIEAHRWSKKNPNVDSEQVSELTESYDWDASVKALIPFERVLTRLSEDLSWTQSLGDAFLQDESRLLQSIQELRLQAKQAGSLKKMDNMEVSYEDNNIAIESVDLNIVYVPYYDSRMVYGSWHWSAYPPVYWQSYHYAYVSHYNPFYWYSGIRIKHNYFFSTFHWHNRHVIVVNPRHSHHYSRKPSRRIIATGGYTKRWSHKPSHRKGVAYRSKRVSNKYHGKRVAVNRVHKPLHSSHHNVKQRLKVSKPSSRKSTYKAKGTVSYKGNRTAKNKDVHVKKNKGQVKRNTTKYASQHKTRSGNVHKGNQRLKASELTREKTPTSKSALVSNKKKGEQQRSHRNVRTSEQKQKTQSTNKSSSYNTASNHRSANKYKERR